MRASALAQPTSRELEQDPRGAESRPLPNYSLSGSPVIRTLSRAWAASECSRGPAPCGVRQCYGPFMHAGLFEVRKIDAYLTLICCNNGIDGGSTCQSWCIGRCLGCSTLHRTAGHERPCHADAHRGGMVPRLLPPAAAAAVRPQAILNLVETERPPHEKPPAAEAAAGPISRHSTPVLRVRAAATCPTAVWRNTEAFGELIDGGVEPAPADRVPLGGGAPVGIEPHQIGQEAITISMSLFRKAEGPEPNKPLSRLMDALMELESVFPWKTSES